MLMMLIGLIKENIWEWFKALLGIIFAHTFVAFFLGLPIIFIGWLVYG